MVCLFDESCNHGYGTTNGAYKPLCYFQLENHPPVTTRKLTTTVWSKEREEMMRQMRVCLMLYHIIMITISIKGREKGIAKTKT